jgi:hypothetical protein
MTTTVTFNLTNSGLNNLNKIQFTPTGTDQYINFDSLVGTYNLFLVNIAQGQGAYIYSYHPTNPSSNFITTTQTFVISGSSAVGTYLTGLNAGNTYTISVTILG